MVAAASAARALAFAPTSYQARSSTALDASAGLFYSTQTGNTETVAGYLADATGLEMKDIGDVKDSEIAELDTLIVGAPTWHTDSETERSGTEWDSWLYDTLPNIDVKGKNVAVFGCGDQQSYSDYFCDAVGELYDLFEAAGANMVGLTSTDDYDHQGSKAERDGKFAGLLCDEDNQYDLSEDRAKAWVEQLKGEGVL